MRPKPPRTEPQEDLFRTRLVNLVDRRHPLVRLAGLIDWVRLEAAFGPLYAETVGRPGLPAELAGMTEAEMPGSPAYPSGESRLPVLNARRDL